MAVKDDVFAIADPIIRELGYELVEVEYVKEGPRWFVRIYLFGPDGVTLDDCRAVNDALSPVLEAQDPVKTPYHLEISSPGAERVLKTDRELVIFQGRYVKVTLRDAIEIASRVPGASGVIKEQVHFGLLGPATTEHLEISQEGVPLSLERTNIKQIRLALSGVPAGK